MYFLILFAIAMLISAIGFKKFVWFISLGYGFSIAGIGVALPIIFWNSLTPVTAIMSLLFVVYGLRLGLYLLIRERRSASYAKTMQNDIKDGSTMKMVAKISIWITCALLYVLEVSPVAFRLNNKASDDVLAIVGCSIMALGIILESVSDFTKNRYKKSHPDRFCDIGVFKIVRCPNYLGEVLTWTGVLVSGIGSMSGWLQYVAAILGWVSIVYIMFGGARRLEIRQNRHYGDNPEYQSYVKKVPILLPLVPLYSVEKHKWLVG